MFRLNSLLAYGALSLLLAGCGGGKDDKVGIPEMDPTAACNALVGAKVPPESIGLPTRGAIVNSTKFVPASSDNTLGEYCLAIGKIDPVDTTAQGITFNIAFPSSWNGKAVHLGGGGWSGFLFPATGASSYGEQPVPLARGYAVFATDSGHQGGGSDFIPDARFAMNDEQLRNFGGDQLKKTHDVANNLIKSRYGVSHSRMYFMGDSGGGHDAMVVFQKWPNDYDGIISGYPAFAWTSIFMKLQMIGREMRINAGAGWISPAKSNRIRSALLQACDSADGLVDNIISNAYGCDFDYNTLLCPEGMDAGESCLSTPQLDVLKRYSSSVPLSYSLANGITALPSFKGGESNLSRGAFVEAFGTTAAFNVPVGGGSPKISEIGANHWFGDTMVRGAIMRDLNADSLSFDPLDPGQYLSRLQEVSAILDATNTEISPFFASRGKLLLMHGVADPLIPAQPSIDYYNSIVQKYGKSAVDDSVGFYLIPGYAHASGISFNATKGLPLLAALENWVENGIPPEDKIVVTDTNPGAMSRTRPLCRFPTWPKYRGSGDINLATSFICASN